MAGERRAVMPTDELYLEPDGEPEFLSDKPVRESIRVKRSPDAAAVGRGNLSRAGKVVVILYEDLANYKAKTEAVAGPGYFFAEYCVDGRTQKTWPFEIPARAPSQASAFEQARVPPLSDVDTRLVRIERALIGRNGERPRNRARRLERVFRHALRHESREQGSGVSKDELYRELMERDREYNREARERERSLYEQMLANARESRQTTQPEETGERSALMLLLEDETIREKAVSSLSRLIDPDSMPQKHWAVELGEMAFNNSDKLPIIVSAGASLIGSVVGLFKGTPKQTAPPPLVPFVSRQPLPMAAPPSPPSQPQRRVASGQAKEGATTFEDEVDSTLTFVLEKCRDNAPVGRAARSVVWLMDNYPDDTKGLESLLGFPGEAICQALSARIPNPEAVKILSLEHAPAWFESLKVAIAKRRQSGTDERASEDVQIPAPFTSPNGDHSSGVDQESIQPS
jgi:hypothetical protein